jgi:hypothetical protein
MKTLPPFETIRTTDAYDGFLKSLYMGVKRTPEEIAIPPVRVIAVTGKEPPSAGPYQAAIAALYGIAYTMKMGLKYGKLPKPAGYFDYRVGALETFWWASHGALDIANTETLRWQAWLMVPAFVTAPLFDEARRQAVAKHPDVPYDSAALDCVNEGHAVQILHVGPYDREEPTIRTLHASAAALGLTASGKHHEIYISDPRRTAPDKLKTVIRVGVQKATIRAAS